MPCYRCGSRQVDPDRGESPWKRGVRDDRQVLICPACQASFEWTADLDRCQVCGSAHLVRRLGEIECRDCGCVREPAPVPVVGGLAARHPSPGPDLAVGSAGGPLGSDSGDEQSPGLAEEVERALARVLGRAGRPARIG
jgi:hypothetical protein